jgi:S1-C subfamily serine protease
MNRRLLWILFGGLTLVLVLGIGAAAGAALTFFALRGTPALARGLETLTGPQVQEAQINPGLWIETALQTGAEEGLVITSLDPDGPAAQAGLARGDIVLSLDGEPLDQPLEFYTLLSELNPGDQVELEIRHGDDERSVTVEVGEIDGHPYLGIDSCGMPFEPGRALQVFASAGALVSEVVADSPAEEAGLQAGDTITAVDGEELGPEQTLQGLLAERQPGDEVTLTVDRPGEEPQELQATLGENPDEAGKAYLGVVVASPGLSLRRQFEGELPALPFEKGMPFGQWFDLQAPEVPEGITQAVLVGKVEPGGPADEAGLTMGDLITEVEGQPVDSLDTLRAALQERQPGDELNLTVYHRGESQPQQVTVTLGEDPQEAGKAYLGLAAVGFFRTEENNQEEPAPGSVDPDIFYFGAPDLDLPLETKPDQEL